MSDNILPMNGSCRCGRVKIRIGAKPIITMACHCTGCQKMSSSAFSLSAAIPTEGFEVTEGEPVIGGLHGAARHYFCPYCMSWMFTRPDGMDFFVNVRPSMLADPDKFPPFVETYMSEKLAWAATSAAYSYDKFPPMEDFPRLMQEYAALPA
ncbi:GFA family protein [Rhizobium sp. KVB221]|uniref:GFA family protein n=1 Tax=Rhizobium setariae TaxID=2801340 RepID=A0A936YIC8_9HYPH|nr:GFA family protein [Rhizobium setariae]MBL0370735.1 GFA family protein [Rhizobium setariae]